MRFAFLARLLGPAYEGYGVQTLLLGLLRGIAELEPGHELVLIVDPAQALPPELRGAFRAAPLAPPPSGAAARLWWDHLAVGMLCRQLGADALYCPAHVRPLYAPCPTVVSVPDMMYHRFPEQWAWSDQAYFRLAVSGLTRRATAIAALSEATRRDLLAMVGAPAERVAVVYPGVPAGFRPVDPAAALARLGVERPYVLCVSSDHPRKNLGGMIAAFEQVAAEVPHELVLAGPAVWASEQVRARVESSPFAGRIRRLGVVPEADLVALYSGADLFALPSLYEGFGFPVLEAMACGCPTITSAVSSLPEVAGAAAILTPPGDTDALADALRRALGDAALRADMGRRGLAQARRFSWRAAAEQTLALLERAARERAAPPRGGDQ
ncbi:MAG TPA: glycosyltransferase family 1 protein [Chloroflexaceae bacterium]|nr:glycosyltransferase family 1 protein [Chloroflexaceae bacterium]